MTQIEVWLKEAADLADADKLDEAAEIAGRILTLDPNNYKALFCIGSVMLKAGRNMQAQQFLRRVCELMPRDHRGWGQLSISCSEMHRYDEAIEYAERALSIKRESRTLADASFAHVTANNWDRGREYAIQSLKIEPGFKDAVFHLANADLAQKRWVEGWEGFKVSEGGKWRKKYTYGDTLEWNGERDAIVMVTGEQGVGDEIMAASCVPSAIASCRKFIFDSDSRLATLFQRSFPAAIVVPTRGAKTVALPLAPTHHKSLFGLLSLFRKQDSDFPREAYLHADPGLRRMFRTYFETLGKRVVGLAWSGGYPRTGLVERSAGVQAFLPLLKAEPDAVYMSLQYKDDAAEISVFERETGCKIHRMPFIAQGQDIDVLAALIAELDEVIGVATTSLHISSALGVKTTWLCNRGLNWVFAQHDLPWYGSNARLWKKDRAETWVQCIASLAKERRERKAA